MLHVKHPLVHPKANEEKRTMFKNRIAKYKEEACSIVYIDESGFVHDMPRTHGYSTVGDRVMLLKIGMQRDVQM